MIDQKIDSTDIWSGDVLGRQADAGEILQIILAIK